MNFSLFIYTLQILLQLMQRLRGYTLMQLGGSGTKLPTRKTQRQMRARLIILTQHQFFDNIDFVCVRKVRSRNFLATDPVVAIFFSGLLTPARDQFFIGNSVMSLFAPYPFVSLNSLIKILSSALKPFLYKQQCILLRKTGIVV